MDKNVKTNIYVDGFNLYYCAVKGTPYKWLNIHKLSTSLLPRHTINSITYFTAHVSARPNDPDQHTRQQLYLRALRTIPNLQIVLGHFLTSSVMMRLVSPPPGSSPYVNVIKTEEKGSDVNIATHLLKDGFMGEYDAAILITNDSDLVEPIKVIRKDLGLVVGVLNPNPRHPSVELGKHASFQKPIRQGALASSQFDDTLADANGTFNKPSSW
ncbi:NYN domain-containing protein [Chloroflexia bacterium SDU3-3]|nr:NYN domain-containing protein [Chloroflexia bacterium SDU3-3]